MLLQSQKSQMAVRYGPLISFDSFRNKSIDILRINDPEHPVLNYVFVTSNSAGEISDITLDLGYPKVDPEKLDYQTSKQARIKNSTIKDQLHLKRAERRDSNWVFTRRDPLCQFIPRGGEFESHHLEPCDLYQILDVSTNKYV